MRLHFSNFSPFAFQALLLGGPFGQHMGSQAARTPRGNLAI